MTSETLIAGVTFPNTIVKAMPVIPGLRSMVFFGTTGDGNNANRVAGGPTLGHSQITPPILLDHTSVNLMATNVRAVATANINAGAVISCTITTPGSGYVNPPSIAFTGTGSGAAGTAVISGGTLSAINITSGGTGYSAPPTVTIIGGNYGCWRSGVTRASQLAGGWTWAAVGRNVTQDAQVADLMSDMVTTSITGLIINVTIIGVDPANSNRPFTRLHTNASVQQTLQLNTSTLGNYHFIASTYTGGAAGTFQLYDLTDGLTATPYVTTGLSSAASQEVTLGIFGDNMVTGINPGMNPFSVDAAFFMVADGPLSLASIQGVYASVKSILARRGVAC